MLLPVLLLAQALTPPPDVSPQCRAMMGEVQALFADLGIGDTGRPSATERMLAVQQEQYALARQPAGPAAMAGELAGLVPGGGILSALVGAAGTADRERRRAAKAQEAGAAAADAAAEMARYSDPRLMALYGRMQAAGC